MIVLKIIGCIILAIFALIAVVLSIKVRIHVEYSDESTNAFIKWLFIKIPVYPREKRTEDVKQEVPVSEPAAASVPSENTETPADEITADDDVSQTEETTTAEGASNIGAPQGNNLLKTLYDSHFNIRKEHSHENQAVRIHRSPADSPLVLRLCAGRNRQWLHRRAEDRKDHRALCRHVASV